MAANATGHISGRITAIEIPGKTIHLAAPDDHIEWSWPRRFEDEDQFARLLDYFQRDAEKIVTYLPTDHCGIIATDVQIFSYAWRGIREEDMAE